MNRFIAQAFCKHAMANVRLSPVADKVHPSWGHLQYRTAGGMDGRSAYAKKHYKPKVLLARGEATRALSALREALKTPGGQRLNFGQRKDFFLPIEVDGKLMGRFALSPDGQRGGHIVTTFYPPDMPKPRGDNLLTNSTMNREQKKTMKRLLKPVQDVFRKALLRRR